MDVESAARPALGARASPTHLLHRREHQRTTRGPKTDSVHNIISMPLTATVSMMYPIETVSSLNTLPDELLLQILGHLDYPFLLALSRVRDLGLCGGSC